MRITHLGFELAPELLRKRAPPSSTSATAHRRPVYLLYRLSHGRALALELVHPRPHAVHVQAEHLVLTDCLPPRVAFHGRLSGGGGGVVHLGGAGGGGGRGWGGGGGEDRSGDGVAELELLEKEDLHHRSEGEALVLGGVGARF
ncbi:hypothetical protein AAC387_Pa02g3518 [Persea americana]